MLLNNALLIMINMLKARKFSITFNKLNKKIKLENIKLNKL